ncbi:MAG: ABC transporter ATP-binding protein [Candidatus Adiutrix sp.]|jgi:putative ABC transport system ATP-binding protein|nr:ABC transporter ATP-binding protein [Candidatus Adiutrix sp.]
MLLEVTRLSKKYTRGGRDFPAVDNLSLSLERGGFICLLGRSGSGKSTFLNMLAGLLTPDAGKISFDGLDIFSLDDRARTLWRNDKLGYVPQGASLLSNLSALDNVRLPYHLGSRKGGSLKKARGLMSDLGLAKVEKSYPPALSGGEMRRVALARAMMNEPELIIADEPTSDLDSETAREIAELFTLLNDRGCAFLLATHDLELSRHGRVLKISDGRLLSD